MQFPISLPNDGAIDVVIQEPVGILLPYIPLSAPMQIFVVCPCLADAIMA